jgi:hypothetical protein
MQIKHLSWPRMLLLVFMAFALVLPAAVQAAGGDELWVPDELTSELHVKAAYNGQEIFWLLQWNAPDGGNLFHDVLVYENGEWVRRGDSGGGRDKDGLREDRVILMVDPGTVPGFANQGCYTACHSGLDSMNDAYDTETVQNAIDGWTRADIRKYIPASRNGETWWDAPWDQVKSKEELEALKAAGVFVDMWHWRSVRSDPIGYSDDQFVLEYRNADGGRSSVGTNWDDDAKQPRVMFDPDKTGIYALDWDKLMAGGYTQDDVYFMSGANTVPYDPNHAWKNGDVLPRRVLRTPEGSMAEITSSSRLSNGIWQVVLRRAMDTQSPDDHALVEGRVYNVGFATHVNATGARWHYISQPQKVGIGVAADITAVRFTGSSPNWDAIPWTTIPMYYPGQINWEWLTSDEHPGAPEIRADKRSCESCHGGDPESILKLAQASTAHELNGQADGLGLNLWLTILAGLVFMGGGTVAAINFSKKGA